MKLTSLIIFLLLGTIVFAAPTRPLGGQGQSQSQGHGLGQGQGHGLGQSQSKLGSEQSNSRLGVVLGKPKQGSEQPKQGSGQQSRPGGNQNLPDVSHKSESLEQLSVPVFLDRVADGLKSKLIALASSKPDASSLLGTKSMDASSRMGGMGGMDGNSMGDDLGTITSEQGSSSNAKGLIARKPPMEAEHKDDLSIIGEKSQQKPLSV